EHAGRHGIAALRAAPRTTDRVAVHETDVDFIDQAQRQRSRLFRLRGAELYVRAIPGHAIELREALDAPALPGLLRSGRGSELVVLDDAPGLGRLVLRLVSAPPRLPVLAPLLDARGGIGAIRGGDVEHRLAAAERAQRRFAHPRLDLR